MNYELVPRTTRRAPKVTIPDLAKAYSKLPKKDGRMSIDPIECLENLLDEYGVDYAWDGDTIYWNSLDCVPWTVERRHDGNLALYSPKCTPRQAVAATLGAGTCEMEYVSEFMSWHCKACDQMDMAPRNPKPRYCKWCGRKVVGE